VQEDQFMRRLVFAIIPFLVLGVALRAADDKEKSTPEEQFRALNDEFTAAIKKAREAAVKAYRAAKTPEEQEKVLDGLKKKAQPFMERFLKLAEQNPMTEAAADALITIIPNSSNSTTTDKAVELLLKDYLDSSKLGELCQALGDSEGPAVEKLLRGVREKSKDHKIKGQATFGLAQFLKNKSESLNLKEGEAEKASKEAETLYAAVVAKFARVPDILEPAKTDLAELRTYGIGKEAPEVVGEDSDGKKLKLSDYRGKVVVLDFWGLW
jgi:hypothetical protein